MIISGIADEAGGDIATQIKAHKELGWNAIELRLVNGKNIASALTENEFEDVRKIIDKSELTVSGFASAIGNWSRHINDDFRVDIEELKTAAKRMKRLGAKYIRIMSWKGDGITESEWRNKSISRSKELAKFAEDNDIVLMHENCEGWGGLSAQNMIELKNEVNSPNFKLLYDLGNTISHGYNPWEFFKIIRGHFDYIHIKDAKINPIGGKSKDYSYCGEGDAMLKEILTIILNEDNYDGVISIEPHVAAIVHLDGGNVEVAPEEKFSSYVKYGEMLEKLIKEIKGK